MLRKLRHRDVTRDFYRIYHRLLDVLRILTYDLDALPNRCAGNTTCYFCFSISNFDFRSKYTHITFLLKLDLPCAGWPLGTIWNFVFYLMDVMRSTNVSSVHVPWNFWI